MSSVARIVYKRSFFAFALALLAGCSGQYSSLLPTASQATTQARIVSKTIHINGQTYVVDNLYTPTNASLQGIVSGPDAHIWFTGGDIVGKSSITGDMTDFSLAPYTLVSAIATGPDHNYWTTLSPAAIGRLSPTGHLDAYPLAKKLGGPGADLFSIASARDGNLWALLFNQSTASMLRISPQGKMNGYKLPAGSVPGNLTAGNDGTLWFTDNGSNSIAHMTAPGNIKEVRVPTQNAGLSGICQAPDGTIWFAEYSANKIGSFSTAGKFNEYSIPTLGSHPSGIVAGPDGAIWFAEEIGQIGRMTTSGSFVELPVSMSYSLPVNVTVGSDKNIWFTQYQAGGVLGRVDLHQVKDSQPKYSSFTLSLEKRAQLGLSENIPLQVEVRDPAGNVVKGTYPYPIHLTTTDPKNAALSLHLLTSSSTKVNVKFSGHYTDATIGANADGEGALSPAIVLPSTPKELTLSKPAFNLTAGSTNSIWMCLSDGRIAVRSANGTIDYYAATDRFSSEGCSMVEAPDGNVWFTDYFGNRIGKITPQGQVSFQQLENRSQPFAIALGSDGALWFTEFGRHRIGRLTTDGQLSNYGTPASPLYIVAGADGNLWYDDSDGDIFKLTIAGVKTRMWHNPMTTGQIWSANGSILFTYNSQLTEMSTAGKIVRRFTYPENCGPDSLTSTPDGDLWYYDFNEHCVGRVTPSGTFTTVPTFSQKGGYFSFNGIIYGPNNDVWFTEPDNKGLGYLDPKSM
jgi:streptogramin lyase